MRIDNVMGTKNTIAFHLVVPNLFFFLFISLKIHGQSTDIIMPRYNNSPGFELTVTTCEANFYDSGGSSENYRYGNNAIITICPENPNERINIDFTNYDLQASHVLQIYDGLDTTASTLGSISNALSGTAFFRASYGNATGCLTLTFITSSTFAEPNDNTSYSGWRALVFCTPPIIDIGNPEDLVLNDDISGDGTELFNLQRNTNTILNTQNPEDFTVTYHLSLIQAESGINPLDLLFGNTSNPQTIYARLENRHTGEFATTSFRLVLNEIPSLPPIQTIYVCDTDLDGTIVANLDETEPLILEDNANLAVTFFADMDNVLENENPLTDNQIQFAQTENTIYYRLTDVQTGAFAVGSQQFNLISPPLNRGFNDIEVCRDLNAEAVIDLAALSQNEITDIDSFAISYHESLIDAENEDNKLPPIFIFDKEITVYVRINGFESCVFIKSFQLKPTSIIKSGMVESYTICQFKDGSNTGPVVINSGLNANDFDFQWFLEDTPLDGETSPMLSVLEPGTYKLAITNSLSGCGYTLETSVRLAEVPDNVELKIEAKPFSNRNKITATVNGDGPYTYELSGLESNTTGVFFNVPAGPHSITAINSNGCSSVTERLFIIGYPKFFTPNQDFHNDNWNIQINPGINIQSLRIFNRYGRLMAELKGDSVAVGWDGLTNGTPMPADTYWFQVDFTYNQENYTNSGYFALMR